LTARSSGRLRARAHHE